LPSVAAVTLTVAVQLAAPAPSAPPESVTLEAPADGAHVAPHVLLAPGAAATTRPAGNVSVKPRPVTASAPAGFVSVKVSVVVPPAAIDAAPNALASVEAPKYCTVAAAPVNTRPGEVALRFVPLLV
jgi:hypothetical protein